MRLGGWVQILFANKNQGSCETKPRSADPPEGDHCPFLSHPAKVSLKTALSCQDFRLTQDMIHPCPSLLFPTLTLEIPVDCASVQDIASLVSSRMKYRHSSLQRRRYYSRNRERSPASHGSVPPSCPNPSQRCLISGHSTTRVGSRPKSQSIASR